jgi:hypothetical protein
MSDQKTSRLWDGLEQFAQHLGPRFEASSLERNWTTSMQSTCRRIELDRFAFLPEKRMISAAGNVRYRS